MHPPIFNQVSLRGTELRFGGRRSASSRDIASAYISHDQRRRVTERVVEQVFGISRLELSGTSRGHARAAFARQIGMYITHVVCGLTLTDVGRAFERDRTTVAHACGVVEDRRDDPLFDQTIERVERIVRALLEPRIGDDGTKYEE